ncbi:unnamed protein product [Trichobilharzia szidati]|nr:unnamed protein product [Trichobilharzia szidati]
MISSPVRNALLFFTVSISLTYGHTYSFYDDDDVDEYDTHSPYDANYHDHWDSFNHYDYGNYDHENAAYYDSESSENTDNQVSLTMMTQFRVDCKMMII